VYQCFVFNGYGVHSTNGHRRIFPEACTFMTPNMYLETQQINWLGVGRLGFYSWEVYESLCLLHRCVQSACRLTQRLAQ